MEDGRQIMHRVNHKPIVEVIGLLSYKYQNHRFSVYPSRYLLLGLMQRAEGI